MNIQISPGSRGDSLGMRSNHPLFLRTVAPSSEDFLVTVQVLQRLEWNYVSMLYDERNKYQANLQREYLEKRGICIAAFVQVHKDANKTAHAQIIDVLLDAKGAIGVIALLSGSTLATVWEAAENQSTLGKLIWLGNNGIWRLDLNGGFPSGQTPPKGTVIITHDISSHPRFDANIAMLKPYRNGTKWMKGFWQDHFQCNLDYDGKYIRICTGEETLSGENFSNHPLVSSTIRAVYSYAVGMTRLLSDKCGKVTMPPCAQLASSVRLAHTAHLYIRNSKIPWPGGEMDRAYTEEGDGMVGYRILNIQQTDNDSLDVVQVRLHVGLRDL